MKKRVSGAVICLFFMCAAFSAVSCSHAVEQGIVSVADGTVMSAGSPVSSGFILSPGISLSSGAHSFAAVQIPEKGIIVLYPDTEVSLTGKGVVLQRGELYVAMQKKEKFLIESANASAASKGAIMTVASSADGIRFCLLSGACDVVPVRGGKPDDDKEFELRERYSADVIEGRAGSHFPLKEDERRDFAVLASVSPASDPASADPMSVIPFAVRDVLMRVTGDALSSEFQLKKLAMEKGPLRVITLKDGRRYIGPMSVQGSTTHIMTVTGEVQVPSKQVKNVSMYE